MDASSRLEQRMEIMEGVLVGATLSHVHAWAAYEWMNCNLATVQSFLCIMCYFCSFRENRLEVLPSIIQEEICQIDNVAYLY